MLVMLFSVWCVWLALCCASRQLGRETADPTSCSPLLGCCMLHAAAASFLRAHQHRTRTLPCTVRHRRIAPLDLAKQQQLACAASLGVRCLSSSLAAG